MAESSDLSYTKFVSQTYKLTKSFPGRRLQELTKNLRRKGRLEPGSLALGKEVNLRRSVRRKQRLAIDLNSTINCQTRAIQKKTAIESGRGFKV